MALKIFQIRLKAFPEWASIFEGMFIQFAQGYDVVFVVNIFLSPTLKYIFDNGEIFKNRLFSSFNILNRRFFIGDIII